MTCGDINDAEASMTQTDAAVDEQPLVVWTTMDYYVAHALDYVGVDCPA
jgi:hypothetical protein